MPYTPFNPWQQSPFGMADPMDRNALFQRQQVLLAQQQNKLNAMNMAHELGQLISMRRNSVGLTHDQLADYSGVPAYEIIQIEAGSGDYVPMEKYLRVMAALRLNLSAYPF